MRNDTTAPAVAVGLPSNWQSVRNRAFQVHGGLTSVVTPQLVNDVRLSYNYLGGDLDPIPAAACTDPLGCVGAGGPNILVFDAPQFRIGNQMNSPFDRWQRTLQLVDSITWQKGNHRIRAGGEWEHSYIKATLAFNEPAQMTLWGPSNLQTPAFRSLYDALPASLRDPAAPAPTTADILQIAAAQLHNRDWRSAVARRLQFRFRLSGRSFCASMFRTDGVPSQSDTELRSGVFVRDQPFRP